MCRLANVTFGLQQSFFSISMTSQLAQAVCVRCRAGFNANEQMVNSNGEIYHEECFVCAQCFQKFPEGLFYEVRFEITGTIGLNVKKIFSLFV